MENGSEMGVLQFHAGASKPSLMNKYIGRLDFDPANGSFVLHHLTSEDTGLYILSINLQDNPVRTVQLRIMDELSKPSILSNSSSLYSTVQLTCDVFGNPHEYQWQKDGGEISQHHQLINGNRSLIIPSATKGDCGTYTCIATNPIGSTQADYTLIIYGLPSKQIVIVVASIAGLMLSSVSLIGLLLLCCLKRESSQASLRHDKHLFLSLFSSNTLSLVAIFIALASWIAIKGAGPLSVVTLCLVAILLAFAVTVTIAVWNSGCLCIKGLFGNTGKKQFPYNKFPFLKMKLQFLNHCIICT
ncbi:HEPACAM family member 2-like [Heterodontus francisci]|uniref:HEPACAM family member 2-like n=1 Tax=Heterodontus francisci TaxID=7792 RepID=UPI00355B51A9